MAALLASTGIRLHAVGIGEGHDNHFLTGLTRAAGGSYCPVETLEQQSGTAGAFLGGCASAVAFNAVVELRGMSGASAGKEMEEPREQPEGRIRRRSTRKRGHSPVVKTEDTRASLQAEQLKEEGEQAGDRALTEEEDAARGNKRVRGIVTRFQGGGAQGYRAQRIKLEGEQAEVALTEAAPAGRQIKREAGEALERVKEEPGATYAWSIKEELEAAIGEHIKEEPGLAAYPEELAQLVEVLGGENAGLTACCPAQKLSECWIGSMFSPQKMSLCLHLHNAINRTAMSMEWMPGITPKEQHFRQASITAHLAACLQQNTLGTAGTDY